MLRSTLKLLPFLLLVLFTANSCKKKNDQKSKTQLITETDWRFSEFRERVNNDPWDDYLAGAQACELDNRIVFKTNNSYEVNEGPSKCDISDPNIVDTGSWALIDNDSKIMLDGDNFVIEELSNNKMALVYTETVGSDTYTLRIVFVH